MSYYEVEARYGGIIIRGLDGCGDLILLDIAQARELVEALGSACKNASVLEKLAMKQAKAREAMAALAAKREARLAAKKQRNLLLAEALLARNVNKILGGFQPVQVEPFAGHPCA